MANVKITGYTALAVTPASGDLIEIIDVSDTTDAATGTNKKITYSNLTGTFLANLVEDTTPELGGDLDFNASIGYDATEFDNGNSGTSDTIVISAGHFQKSTLTGNVTFTFTAPTGPTRIQLRLIQDGTGSRSVTWPGTVKWEGGTAPTLSTSAASVDIITITFDGTNYYGGSNLDFS